MSDHFFTGSGDGMVGHWNLESGEMDSMVIKIGQPVFSIIVIQDLNLLIAGTSSGSMHIIDLAAKKEIKHITLHKGGIFSLEYSEKQKTLFASGGDGVLSSWSLPDFELIRSIPFGEFKLRKLALDHAQGRLAIACGDGQLRVLETNFLNEIHTLPAHVGGVGSVKWHPYRKVLVSGGKDGFIRCWSDSGDFAEVLAFPAHKSPVYEFSFDQTGQICASCGTDKTVKLWDSSVFQPIGKMDFHNGGHNRSVNDLCWIGKRLVSVGDDRKAISWNFQ